MGKRLIICCDGTWNSLVGARDASGLTNVARLYLSVPPVGADGVRQVVRYVPGVGTGPLERLRGGVFGFGLSRRVKEAYRFLVDNYEPGDELWFFGFSRGAFTARSAAGFVRKCSILRADQAERLAQAYRLYRVRGPRGHPDAEGPRAFRARHSHPGMRIRFIGVWDTVGALGFPVSPWNPLRVLNAPWAFHDTTLSSSVDQARHAVAIDERRGPFRPTLWQLSEKSTPMSQTVHQAWFCGAHSDVGGGVRPRDGEGGRAAGLSQVAFAWMLREAEGAGLGVDWTLCPLEGEGLAPLPPWMVARARERGLGGADPSSAVRALASPPDPGGPVHDSRRGFYALIPAHDRDIPYLAEGDDGVPVPYPGQWVAASARDRAGLDGEYRALSTRLVRYLESGGLVNDVVRPGGRP
jgi:uncharacterized protein (DUF2235 family)